MLLVAAFVVCVPLLLASEEEDRLTPLVAEMRRLTFAGDDASVGRLVPAVLKEIARPHPQADIAWNQVGVCFQTQGNFAEAERAYQRGIRVGERKAGQNLLLLNLATLYLETGQRPAQAELLCRRALKQAIEVYGPGSSELTTFLYVLAIARQQQGDRKDSRRLFHQALDLAADGRDGELRRGLVLGNLAFLSALDRQWIQAEGLLLQSIALMEPSLDPSHPDSVVTHLNLARVYEHLKQWARASASLARAREMTETRLSPDHPFMAEILRTSASIPQKTGHGREARDVIRRAKVIEKAQPKDSASHAWVHLADLMRPARRY